MSNHRRIRLLEEQVESLKREKRAFLEAIDMAANTGNFQISLNKIDDPMLIIRETGVRIRQILDFKSICFYIVNEEDSDFYQQYTDPPEASQLMEDEVDALIDDKTFAWALGRNKPVMVTSIDKKAQVVLHSMATSSRVRGIFIGILAAPKDEIMDFSLFLFSITIIACSNALESFELYRQIRNRNEELKEKFNQLKKSQQSLSEQEELYRVLFEQAANSIILFDPDTMKPVEFNDNACLNLGYNRQEFKELAITDYEVDDTIGEILEQTTGNKMENCAFFETRHKRKDGKIRNIIINVRPVNIRGKMYLLSLHTDITLQKEQETERIHLQKQLRQSQKMESIGTLAGGIAHDFNNILAIILGYAELTLVDLIEDGDSIKPENIRGNLASMVNAVERAKKLIGQILTFSRQKEELPRPINVNEIVKEALDLIRSTLPTTIEIKQSITTEPLMIMGEVIQVHQIMMNLCTNSAHAMKGINGLLKIDLRRVANKQKQKYVKAGEGNEPAPGNYVQLTVSDNGKGMPGDVMERVYEPYFTTKKPGEGTGLGLAVIHGIVESYKGHIDISSILGEGTVITICIPELSPQKVEEFKKNPKLERTAGGEAIMLKRKTPGIQE